MAKKQSRSADPNTTRFSIQAFNTAHFRTTEAYAAMIDVLFDRATDAITKAAARGEYDPDKPFSFDDYPELKKKMQETLVQLTSRMTTVIETGTKQEWLFAVRKNDAFLASIMDTSKLTKAQLAQLQDRNLDGLKAFQERKGKMGLSKEVWKIGKQYQDQIQDALDVGLGDGRSAQALARDVKQNLKHPDKLFRRVRDKHGNLRLSKAAAAYHPGQGVYRSAVRNAQRLTRTEINMAYRESDYQRWQQLDFVVGFEVFRSNHDPLCKCKVCEKLVGRYPKNFKFVGWHPQCMCYAVPILMDEETFDENELGDLKAALRGTEYKKKQAKNLVTTMPDGFNEWVAVHADRQAGWKSTPYFIRDNFKNGSLADGLKDSIFDGMPTTQKTDPVQDELNMMAAEINKAIQYANYWGLGHLSGKLQNAVNAKDVAGVKATIAEINKECARVEAIRNKWLADANALIAECKSLGVDSSALEQAKVDILPEHWGTSKTQQMAQQMLDDVRKAVDAFKALQANMTDKLGDVLDRATKSGVSTKDVAVLPKVLTETEIVERVGGGDLTRGSCSSLALAFAANKGGLDVLDYRDGKSREHFASWSNIMQLAEKVGGVTSYGSTGIQMMKQTQIGKLYYLAAGRHAAVVRQVSKGKYEYMELQTESGNGWHSLDSKVFAWRFSARGRDMCALIDIELLNSDKGFRKLMSYINTDEDKQKKGKGGTAK